VLRYIEKVVSACQRTSSKTVDVFNIGGPRIIMVWLYFQLTNSPSVHILTLLKFLRSPGYCILPERYSRTGFIACMPARLYPVVTY